MRAIFTSVRVGVAVRVLSSSCLRAEPVRQPPRWFSSDATGSALRPRAGSFRWLRRFRLLLSLLAGLIWIVGAVLLAGLFFMLTLGMIAFKVFLFVVLPIWLIWKVAGWLFGLFRPKQETVVAS